MFGWNDFREDEKKERKWKWERKCGRGRAGWLFLSSDPQKLNIFKIERKWEWKWDAEFWTKILTTYIRVCCLAFFFFFFCHLIFTCQVPTLDIVFFPISSFYLKSYSFLFYFLKLVLVLYFFRGLFVSSFFSSQFWFYKKKKIGFWISCACVFFFFF